MLHSSPCPPPISSAKRTALFRPRGLECPLGPGDGPVFECIRADPSFVAGDATFDIEDSRAVRLRFRVRRDLVDPLEHAFDRTMPQGRRTT